MRMRMRMRMGMGQVIYTFSKFNWSINPIFSPDVKAKKVSTALKDEPNA